jgi:hypothetical protein
MLLLAGWVAGMPLAAWWFWRDADRWGERRPWFPVVVWPVAAAVLLAIHSGGWLVRRRSGR